MMQTLYYDRDARPVSWQRWRRYGRQVTVITGAANQLPAPDPDPDPDLPVLPPSGAGQGR
jgi:hypothetical protein